MKLASEFLRLENEVRALKAAQLKSSSILVIQEHTISLSFTLSELTDYGPIYCPQLAKVIITSNNGENFLSQMYYAEGPTLSNNGFLTGVIYRGSSGDGVSVFYIYAEDHAASAYKNVGYTADEKWKVVTTADTTVTVEYEDDET